MGGSVYAFDRAYDDDLELLDSLELDYGVCGLHRIPFAGAGDDVHYLIAGTARGHIYLLQYDHGRDCDDRLQIVYRSEFLAPMAGAYDSIRSFNLTGNVYRVVLGSSGGVFALDFDLPTSFTP